MKAGIDVETTALDPEDGKLSLVQVAAPGKPPMVFDVLRGPLPPLPTEGIAHNAVFEERWLGSRGHECKLDDTMIASQVFYTGTNAAKGKLSHSLASVVSRELKRELPKDLQQSDWSQRPLTQQQLEYAARDAMVLPELFDRLMEKIEKAGLRDVYELELRVARAVDQMQRNGFAVNVAKLDPLVEEVTEQAERLKAELEAEWKINPGSSSSYVSTSSSTSAPSGPQQRAARPRPTRTP
jgi:DNA polymerase-1